MATKTHRILPDPAEVEELILKVLDRHPEGLPSTKLRTALPVSHRLSAPQLSVVLEDMERRCIVHGFVLPRTKAGVARKLYSREPLQEWMGGRIREAVAEKPLLVSELKRSFPAILGPCLPQVLDSLVQSGTIRLLPPLKGTKTRYSLSGPDPLEYLAPELDKLFARGIQLGFKYTDIVHAVERLAAHIITPKRDMKCSDGEDILETMITLKPAAAKGALVYLPDLRAAMKARFPDKDSFDRAVMHLAELERVQLQSHSLPAQLSAEERENMIDNHRGSYFMAIGIRME
jgi:hypothetical protein